MEEKKKITTNRRDESDRVKTILYIGTEYVIRSYYNKYIEKLSFTLYYRLVRGNQVHRDSDEWKSYYYISYDIKSGFLLLYFIAYT